MNRFQLLAKVVKIAQSTVEFEEKLQNIVYTLSRDFGCDLCAIFLLDKQNESLTLNASSDPNVLPSNSLSIPVGEGVIGIPVSNRKPLISDGAKITHDPKLTVPTPLRDFSSFASFPIGDNDFTYGVLTLAGRDSTRFRPGQEKLLRVISQELAGLIKNFRVYMDAKKRITELSALADVAKSVTSTIELDEILKLIVSIIARVIRARASVLRVADGVNGKLRVGSQYGPVPDVCIKDSSGLEFNQTNQVYCCDKAIKTGGAMSVVSVPLISKGRLQGVLCVFDKEIIGTDKNAQFDADDMALLSAMAGIVSAALENAFAFNQVERLAKELRTVQEKLIESEKMAARSEIASALAHEIRNPLVAVGGLTRRIDKIVNRGFEGNSPAKRYLKVIVGEVEKLEKILRELLDFSVAERVPQRKCSVNTMIEEVLDTLRRDFENTNIRILKEFSEVPLVYGDRNLIKYVISNLILNAKQAMGVGGTLTLRTYKLMEDNVPMVVCEIGDTGGGIPDEVLHNIFSPFFTTKLYGTGLGLSIAQKIIARHHGEINVRNQPGVGVTFIIKLPSGNMAPLQKKERSNLTESVRNV